MAKSIICALALYCLTAYFNPGFIAVDDYSSNIEVIVPAQLHSFPDIVKASDFRPPFANLAMGTIVHLALKMGVTHPSHQLEFLRVVLGLIALLAFAFSARLLFPTSRERIISFSVMAFYFISPLLYTRPLIEGVCAPWLLLSAALCAVYLKNERPLAIIGSVVCLAIASVIRYQSGVCLAALFISVLSRRRWAHLLWLIGTSAIFFLAIGLWDHHLKGVFHGSFLSYWSYNQLHSSSYGTTPFYSYALLFIITSLPVLAFSQFSGFPWRERYRPMIVPGLYLGLFVVFHSLIPHKEERFMVPVLPLFFVMFAPLVGWGIEKLSRVRLITAAIIWIDLLIIGSANTPQRNVLEVARYIDQHPRIQMVLSLRETLSIFPRVMIARSVSEERVESIPAPLFCNTVLALYKHLHDVNSLQGYEMIGRFAPGLGEKVIIWLNPKNNLRRGTIELWRKEGCE